MSKYIAAGFIDDAQKLYDDFAKCPDNDFKTFCNVWKKHKFGCIFMGRSDHKELELREFTSEIFQLTLNFMGTASFESQIAAIYLLYALYRNQYVISPVKIRVSKLQFCIIQQVHVYAVKEKVHALHYIIDYLKKNCLEFVANSTLYTPCYALNKDDLVKSKANQFVILPDLHENMAIFHDNDVITNLKKQRNRYFELKHAVMPVPAAVRDNDSSVLDEYEESNQKLYKVLGKSRNCSSGSSVKHSSCINKKNSLGQVVEKSDIGHRRFRLKNAASKLQVMLPKNKYHEEFSQCENIEDTSVEKISLKKTRFYNKRLPVNERRIGRPRKQTERTPTSDESDDSDFKYSIKILPEQVKKTKRGPTGRRNASYLKNHEGPVFVTTVKKEPIEVEEDNETSEESFEDQFLEF